VALLKEFYGRGPLRAKSLASDYAAGASASENTRRTMSAEGIHRDVGAQRGGGTI
jgi:hypothetical protein